MIQLKDVEAINLNISLSIILFFLTLLLASMTIYLLDRYSVPDVKYLICLCIVSSIYSFGYGMELLSKSLEQVDNWGKIQYLGIPFIPMFWVLFSISFTKRKKISALLLFFFGIIPALTLIIRLTNDNLSFFYRNMKMVYNGYFMVLSFDKGVWYYVQFFYYLLCTIISICIYWQHLRKVKGTMRKQALIMFISSLLVLIPLFLNSLGVTPFELDLGPFFILIMYGVFLVAIYRYHILNLLPIVKDKIFQWIQDGVLVVDMGNNLIEYNPAAQSIFPTIQKNKIGNHIKEILKDYDEVLSQLENPQEEFVIMIPSKGCEEKDKKIFQVRISKVMDGDLQIGRTVLLSDITKKVELMKQLEDLASKDELTGLYNRRAFFRLLMEETTKLLTQQSVFSFVLIDIDFFKKINDTYGHLAGDQVLMEFSERSMDLIKNKGILGRFGGEEFSLLLPDMREDEARQVCERLKEGYEAVPVLYKEQQITFTASFGISSYDYTNEEALRDFKSIINRSDLALYKAKSMGRNTIEVWNASLVWDTPEMKK